MSDFTIIEFMSRFPDDDSCLDHLMGVRFGLSGSCPKCGREGKYHRVKKRPVYECQWCGYQISPMAGTPFAKSRTPLQKWFYAMYLFTTSRHGVPAKELQRQLGVTYKCAWRMGHEIRKYMTDVDGDGQYGGGAHVEMDETFMGGRKRKKDPLAKRGYEHGTVCHEDRQWRNGVHHTNTIEGFCARLKSSIRGTHIHVSRKYLPNYLGEFEYRYNMRKSPKWMFERLLGAF